MGIRDSRWIAVGVEEAVGQLVLGEPRDLAEDLAGGLDVDVLIRPGAEHAGAVEDLEQVELEVAQVALVVTHLGDQFLPWARACEAPAPLLVGNH